MFEKKKQTEHKPRDDGVELENQFIIRFPKVCEFFLAAFEDISFIRVIFRKWPKASMKPYRQAM